MANEILLNTITDGDTDGVGTFDVLMRSFKAHLEDEYDSGRITGNEYTQAYISLTTMAMQQAMQFEMSKKQQGFATDITEEQAKQAVISTEVATAVKQDQIDGVAAQTDLVQEQVSTQVNQTDMILAQTEVTRERGGFR